jgi:hypothetical protein
MTDNHSTAELSSFGMPADVWRQRLHTSLMMTVDSTVAKEEGDKTKIWVYNNMMMMIIIIIIS